jgi:hypothetical protein
MSDGEILGLVGLLWLSAAAIGFAIGWTFREERGDD